MSTLKMIFFMINRKILEKKIKSLGLSIYAFEKVAGLKRDAIQNILHERSKQPSLKTLQAIAQALDCKIADFISFEDGSRVDKGFSTTKWGKHLFVNTIEAIDDEAKKMRIAFTSPQEILNIVEEVYTYSLETEQPANDPDLNFIRWTLKKLQ